MDDNIGFEVKAKRLDDDSVLFVACLGGDEVTAERGRLFDGSAKRRIAKDWLDDERLVELDGLKPPVSAVIRALEAAELTVASEEAHAILLDADAVTPTPIDWLWPGRFALGKLSLLTGDPGLCKSTLGLDVVARVSAGRSWPDLFQYPNPAGGAVVISAEDDPQDTIVPRLLAHSADLKRVKILQGKQYGERPAAFTLADVDALDNAIRRTPDCRLVLVDPISSYMPTSLDSHRNADVRSVLAPLADLAAARHIAVVCISHLNKNSAVRAAYRTTGSLAFVAAARSVWLAVNDADLPQRNLFIAIKNNLARLNNGMAYSVESWLNDGMEQPQICWSADVICKTADEAFEALSRREDKRRQRGKPTDAWLENALAAGPQPVSVLQKMADDAGISWPAVKRAKDRLGVRPVKDGFDGGWTWRLDEDADSTSTTA